MQPEPDAVRALIAEAEANIERAADSMPPGSVRESMLRGEGADNRLSLLVRLSAALSALLPPEDTDLDTTADLIAPHMSAEVCILGGTSGNGHGPRYGWSCPCQSFSERSCFSDQFETRDEARWALARHLAVAARAARTVETAEEWEYAARDAVRVVSTFRTLGMAEAYVKVRRGLVIERRRVTSWEPVPPTPETEEQP